jgi:hypothetical protein
MAERQPGPGTGPTGLRKRLTRGWVLVVEIATVVAGVVALVAYLFPRPASDAGSGAAQRSGPPAAAATVPSTAAATGPSTPDPGLALTELTPSEGAAYLSTTGTASTIALRCPSGNSGDTSRTVVYDVRGQYRRLVAQVQVSGSAKPPTRSTLEVLADEDRTGLISVDGNGTKPLTAELTVPNRQGADPVPAQRLSLRVTCRLVGPTITLINPRLEP